MPISDRLAQLGSGVFARNDRRKTAYLNLAGDPTSGLPPLLDLSLGSTDLLPPTVAIEAMAAQLDRPESAAYCLHGATAPLRQAVARWARRRFGVEVDAEREVLLLVGSQEGTAHLPLAVLNPGDGALLLDPYYPSHMGGLRLASARPRLLRLDPASGWRPDFETLSAQEWQQQRLMVLGFPHNPTATTGEQAWLDGAVAKAMEHDIVLAHDNPYVDLALDGEAPALLRNPAWRQCGIEFFSFSKSWCLGGFRLAFAIGAEWLIRPCASSRGWWISISRWPCRPGRSRPWSRPPTGPAACARCTAVAATRWPRPCVPRAGRCGCLRWLSTSGWRCPRRPGPWTLRAFAQRCWRPRAWH
jgi:aspartate/methionine/tyrosine aminotransferase